MDNKKQVITTEKFIQMGKEVHGDKFDYSEAVYVNAKTKIKLTCKNRHTFETLPKYHIGGYGCKKCTFNINVDFKVTNLETFIGKSKIIHGENKFDYSLAEYINGSTLIKLICDKGHVFEQLPRNHLCGSKCNICTGYVNINKKPDTIENMTKAFIAKSKNIHGETYNYDLVVYENSFTEVKINCPTGHIFEQKPFYHLRGSGCNKCFTILKKTTDEFIKKSKQIHGDDTYDYSEVEYITVEDKVKLICKKEGHIHFITPNEHYKNNGCMYCKNSTEKKVYNHLYKKFKSSIIHQKRFKNILEIKNNPFDLYFPDYNLIIEIDGDQHFKTVDYFKETYEERQLADFKKMYHIQKNNNITIVRIYQMEIYKNSYDWKKKILDFIKKYDEPQIIYFSNKKGVYDDYCSNYKKFLENYNY